MRIFAGDFWPLATADSPEARYKRFLDRGRPQFAQLIQSFLLYDSVVVPTQDFMTATLLVDVLGKGAVEELVEGGDLKFSRLKGAFGYVGNGGGLKSYEITTGDDRKPEPSFADLPEAVGWALAAHPTTNQDKALAKKMMAATKEVLASDISNEVMHETYMDVLDSPYLESLFALRSRDMNKLAGIGPNQVRFFDRPDLPTWKGDEIDIVLALAAANVELRLASKSGCDDSSTVAPVGHLLKAKFERTFHGAAESSPYLRLVDVAGMPDPGELVLRADPADREGIVLRLLKAKRSKDGSAFRDWFHKSCRTPGADVAKEYIKLLEGVPKIESLPARMIRFIATTLIGFIPGGGGVAASVAASAGDSFLLGRILRGTSPKFYIENLRQIHSKFGPPPRSQIVTS